MRGRQPLLQTNWICQPFRRLARLIRTDHLTSEKSATQQLSQILGYFGLRHPAFCCLTTLAAASAELGTR